MRNKLLCLDASILLVFPWDAMCIYFGFKHIPIRFNIQSPSYIIFLDSTQTATCLGKLHRRQFCQFARVEVQ